MALFWNIATTFLYASCKDVENKSLYWEISFTECICSHLATWKTVNQCYLRTKDSNLFLTQSNNFEKFEQKVLSEFKTQWSVKCSKLLRNFCHLFTGRG